MNKLSEKWMAADLYEKCLICDGKGQIFPIHAASKACPECEGIGFMLIGMTVGELEKLKAKVETIAEVKAAVLANPPWIPVVGDRVRCKAHGTLGVIKRVFRGDPAGFQPNRVLIDVTYDTGGNAYSFSMSEFEPNSLLIDRTTGEPS